MIYIFNMCIVDLESSQTRVADLARQAQAAGIKTKVRMACCGFFEF